ncbi:MAG TPA: class I SAM-dependent methyltransferase [Polyangiaceae bacterium]|nr:class I SAM-dependent methyltransferase [Polyangiaceae bacterium]
MGFYEDVVLPHVIDFTCGMKELDPERAATAAGLSGTVLEIGFGSGLNLPHLPPGVERVLAVDPSARGRKIASKRIAALGRPVVPIGLDAGKVDAETASADSALCTFTLCTVPRAEDALAEVRRVLKPGGRFHFLEHGQAPDPSVKKWQDRLNGFQRFVAGGCNLNRDVFSLVRGAGFAIVEETARYFPGMPKTHAWLCRGVAVAS